MHITMCTSLNIRNHKALDNGDMYLYLATRGYFFYVYFDRASNRKEGFVTFEGNCESGKTVYLRDVYLATFFSMLKANHVLVTRWIYGVSSLEMYVKYL